jgi:hypothetical protein
MPEMNGACLFINMIYLEKSDVLVFLIVLRKSDVSICQTELFDFGRQNICFSQIIFCDLSVMCVTYYLFTTHFCCTPRMHAYRESSLRFP